MRVDSYEDLEVWQLGMDLVVDVYRLTDSLPARERFNLISQINRAAVSVPCNIAEGWGRGLGASQANFLRIARGSLYETKTLIEIIRRLCFAPDADIARLREKSDLLGRKLNAYLSAIERQTVREERAEYDTP